MRQRVPAACVMVLFASCETLESREGFRETTSDAEGSSCQVEKVRSLSESCCEAYGPDACGAGLFCAAFDGRTVSTCYPNNARLGGETCKVDSHCASKLCAKAGVCASLPNEACVPEAGCAAVGADRYVCVASECNLVGYDGYCLEEADCLDSSYACRDGRCTDKRISKYAGEACDETVIPNACISGNCFRGTCGCNKETSAGCPSGKACTGGNHVVWGTRCE